MQKHNWKTLFQLATGRPPNLSHLRKIECKAYTLDKHIPQKEKLREWAHIGNLVGYDSTNIFRVWIPSQHKIIRTRDVLFDETALYNPSEPDLAQLITKPMIETSVFNIPRLDIESQITEIEFNEEEKLTTETETVSLATEILQTKETVVQP